MLFSLWSSYGKKTYEYTVRLLISKNLCAMYWTVSNYFFFKKLFTRKIILNMWNVKMNVWLINFFATPKFYSFWWLLYPWILLEKVCAWGWRPLRLETDIEKKIKTKNSLKRQIDVSVSMPLIFEMLLSLFLRTAMMKGTLWALFIKFNR